PAGSNNMTRPKDGGRKAGPPGLAEQKVLDFGLLRAIAAEGIFGLVFGRRDRGVVAIDPDGTAMQELLHLAAQRLNDLPRARQSEADHVDDDVGPEIANARAECAGCLLGVTVGDDRLD